MQTRAAKGQQIPPPVETPGTDQCEAQSAPSAEAIEAWIVGRLAGVLACEPVEIDRARPLMMLGLSSMDAFILTGELSEWLGQELPSTLLWEYPTVKDLAWHLGPSVRHVAASFQEQMWFLQQLAPESPAFNIPFHVRLRGPLNVAALEQSLNEIRRRHDVLRTTFEATDGRPAQVVAAPKSAPLPVEDLQHLDPQEREQTAGRLSVEETRRPFDLASGPLLRCRLLRLAADDHILLRTVHHAIADAWSLGVFRYELSALYEAYSTGKAPSLAELPLQYAQFVQRQQEQLSEETLESQVTHWKRKLAEPLPHLSLPQRQVSAVQRTWQGARYSLTIPAPLVDALRGLGARHSATLFMTVAAAFKVLLHRYTGAEDIIVGTAIAARRRPESRPLIGPLLNTLLLRTDLSGEPTFHELIARVRETALAAYAHQDVPFETLLNELRTERSADHNSLLNVMLVVEPEVREQPLRELDSSAYESDVAQTTVNLTFKLRESRGQLTGCFEYSTDLFDADTIERMAGHFLALLEGIVGDPDLRIAALPLLTPQERLGLLAQSGATASGTAILDNAISLIESQAANTPEKTAVRFGDCALTYGELNDQANQLAHYLRGLGVAPDMPVGICLDRSPQLLVAMLGILKAGGAYVPLDPSHPQARLDRIVADSQLSILLTDNTLASRWTEHAMRVVRLDADRVAIAGESRANPAPIADAANLAYVIYTSGSTGDPKGVAVTRGALANLLGSMQRRPGISSSDVLLAVTTLAFDIAALELLLPLVAGACVVIADQDTARDGRRLGELIGRHGVTIMQATPATWRLLVETDQPLAGLKVLSGGEALPRQLADRLLAAGADVWNLYGPTETTIWSTVDHVLPEELITIGRPIDNTSVFVLDSRLQLVPVGVAGELYIGGAGLARGYWIRPELTAEKFIRNPFSADASARLYRTGDRARWLPDGRLELFGRLDHQVKIRGFRVELGEIESILSRHPQVRQTVVVSHTAAADDVQLVAYIVPADATVTQEELRTWLARELPDYLVPTAFVSLESLPLSPNGKIDRGALPAPEAIRPTLAQEFVAPRTPLEQAVAEIWQGLLHVDQVGIHDNFFSLGGHSLLATQALSRIHKRLNIELPVRSLFEAPTVAALALVLLEQLYQ